MATPATAPLTESGPLYLCRDMPSLSESDASVLAVITGVVQTSLTWGHLKQAGGTIPLRFATVGLAGIWDWRRFSNWRPRWDGMTVVVCEDRMTFEEDLQHCRTALRTALRQRGAVAVVFTWWSDDFVQWLAHLTDIVERGAIGSAGPQAHVGDSGTWEESLLLTSAGQPRPVFANALAALRSAPEWQDVICRDAFSSRTFARKPTPWGYTGEWEVLQDSLTAEWLQHRQIMVSPAIAARAVETIAEARQFHPVREYIEALRWDGTSRIHCWLSTCTGCEQSDYTSAIGAKWLISGIARVVEPGSKVDHVLILEGPQGMGKSSVFKVLGGEWFSDQLDDLGSKDSMLQLGGVWVLELAELEALNRVEVKRINAFISRTADRFRAPYQARTSLVRRQCIFGGTVNPRPYLRDESGGRRFWPVECASINLGWLTEVRDQLWAEAALAYSRGQSWWLDDTTLLTAARTEQAARYEQDPWHPAIMKWCEEYDTVSIDEILDGCLQKPRAAWTQADKRRIARTLAAAGWVKYQQRAGEYRHCRYRAPGRRS